MKKKLAVISFSERGFELAKKIRDVFTEENPELSEVILYRKTGYADGTDPDAVFVGGSLHEWCAAVFSDADALIFIGASGIAVRTIAPFLVSKTEDPAVLVADEAGKHIISLLSGHLGGGNALTSHLAEKLGADPVITTASDVGGKLAVDVWAKKNGLAITDFAAAKAVAARIVNGEAVPFYCEGRVRGEIPPELRRVDADSLPEPCLINEKTMAEQRSVSGKVTEISEKDKSLRKKGAVVVSVRTFADDLLHLVPRTVVLGVGCKKGKPAGEIREFVFSLLQEQHVAPHSICKVASIDIKAEEAGLAALAEEFGVPFVTFSAGELNKVPGEYTSSDFVSSVTGVDNVCERAAMAALDGKERADAHFLCRKAAGNGVTAALLERPWEVIFE